MLSSIDEEMRENENHESQIFWKHGTTLQSADIIYRRGIDLKRGGKRQYFSNADGFYVSDSWATAASYGIKASSRYPTRFNFK